MNSYTTYSEAKFTREDKAKPSDWMIKPDGRGRFQLWELPPVVVKDVETVRYHFECACNGEIPMDIVLDGMLKEALTQQSRTSGLSVALCLAELVKYCLLSDTNDPLHVYGPEFIKLVDDVLKN